MQNVSSYRRKGGSDDIIISIRQGKKTLRKNVAPNFDDFKKTPATQSKCKTATEKKLSFEQEVTPDSDIHMGVDTETTQELEIIGSCNNCLSLQAVNYKLSTENGKLYEEKNKLHKTMQKLKHELDSLNEENDQLKSKLFNYKNISQIEKIFKSATGSSMKTSWLYSNS